MEIKDKIKAKIDKLFEKGHVIKYLKASQYERDVMSLDKIKIALHSISSFNETRWERSIMIDFERNPILLGTDAEEVYQYLIKENSNLLEKYLDE